MNRAVTRLGEESGEPIIERALLALQLMVGLDCLIIGINLLTSMPWHKDTLMGVEYAQ